jgi:hypothetical protein
MSERLFITYHGLTPESIQGLSDKTITLAPNIEANNDQDRNVQHMMQKSRMLLQPETEEASDVVTTLAQVTDANNDAHAETNNDKQGNGQQMKQKSAKLLRAATDLSYVATSLAPAAEFHEDEHLEHLDRNDAGNLIQEANMKPAEPKPTKGAPGNNLSPLPFQMLPWQSDVSQEVLRMQEVVKRSAEGTFWVCFPPSTQEQSVEKYAQVFNTVASGQKWKKYPFVWLNTHVLNARYEDHFCDDIEKVTFVIEKKGSRIVDPDSKPESAISTHLGFESPVWFRRVFPSDQHIQVSLVEEFLNDVESGKVPELRLPKRDL